MDIVVFENNYLKKVKSVPDKKIIYNLDRVKNLAAKGLNNNQLAACLGISIRTFQRRMADDEEFANAVEAGRAELTIEMSDLIVESARRGNLESIRFVLERRCGWSKKNEIDVDVSVSQPAFNIYLSGPNTNEKPAIEGVVEEN